VHSWPVYDDVLSSVISS